jgi:hypothetical protein
MTVRIPRQEISATSFEMIIHLASVLLLSVHEKMQYYIHVKTGSDCKLVESYREDKIDWVFPS